MHVEGFAGAGAAHEQLEQHGNSTIISQLLDAAHVRQGRAQEDLLKSRLASRCTVPL